MSGVEKPTEAPKAEDIMGDMMPEEMKSGPKMSRKVDEAFIKEKSKGYPAAGKSGEVFNNVKGAAQAEIKKEYNGKWTPGIVINHEDWNASGQTEMKGNEYILITGNKDGEYHFFKGPEKTKKMKATPAEDYADSNIKNPKEMKDAAKVVKLAKALKSKLERSMGKGHPRTALYETKDLVAAGIVKSGEVSAKVVFAIEDPNMDKKIRIFTGSDFA